MANTLLIRYLRPLARRVLTSKLLFIIATCLITLRPLASHADDPWVTRGNDGQPDVQVYFFWALTCRHCSAAHPHILAIPQARPWVNLHALELTRNPDNLQLYKALARQLGAQATSVPALLFCGEMHVGWDSDETTGALIRKRLDDCHARIMQGQSAGIASHPIEPVHLPLIGSLDPASLSMPVLTLVLAGLDAFNPCAFFVLLFLLSLLAHQKNRARMLAIGGIFVFISGALYFAFMAAWLNVFQVVGHLAWITAVAGALAVFMGIVNVKDFFLFKRGLTLSIAESNKADIFRRARVVLSAERLPAMLMATVFLAIAANFYELLCTAGFPMVYTRVLTLEGLSPVGRYGYLALYNLIYIVPLAVIVALFTYSRGARKLTEREGRLLKLLSGVMMLELGFLLLMAPSRISQAGIALGLMIVAVAITWTAARLTRPAAG